MVEGPANVASRANRVSTGCPELDEMLAGGLLPQRPYLVVGPSGTGKTTLALQFLCEGIRRGEEGLIVTLEEPPNEMRSNHPGLRPALDRVWIFDAIPDVMRYERVPFKDIAAVRQSVRFLQVVPEIRKTPELTSVEVTFSALEQTLKMEVKRRNYARLVIDSLTALQYFCMKGIDETQGAQAFLRFLSDLRITTLLTVESAVEDVETPERLLARGEIRLFRWELDGVSVRGIGVEKFRGSAHDVRLHPYRIAPGGLVIKLDATISHDTRKIIEAVGPPVIQVPLSPLELIRRGLGGIEMDVRDLIAVGVDVNPIRDAVDAARRAVVVQNVSKALQHLVTARQLADHLVSTYQSASDSARPGTPGRQPSAALVIPNPTPTAEELLPAIFRLAEAMGPHVPLAPSPAQPSPTAAPPPAATPTKAESNPPPTPSAAHTSTPAKSTPPPGSGYSSTRITDLASPPAKAGAASSEPPGRGGQGRPPISRAFTRIVRSISRGGSPDSPPPPPSEQPEETRPPEPSVPVRSPGLSPEAGGAQPALPTPRPPPPVASASKAGRPEAPTTQSTDVYSLPGSTPGTGVLSRAAPERQSSPPVPFPPQLAPNPVTTPPSAPFSERDAPPLPTRVLPPPPPFQPPAAPAPASPVRSGVGSVTPSPVSRATRARFGPPAGVGSPAAAPSAPSGAATGPGVAAASRRRKILSALMPRRAAPSSHDVTREADSPSPTLDAATSAEPRVASGASTPAPTVAQGKRGAAKRRRAPPVTGAAPGSPPPEGHADEGDPSPGAP